jgi:hypothetical protein
MTMISSNTITITLGTYSASGLLIGQGTAGGTGTMTWTPTLGPKDLAGNALTNTTAVSESGAVDTDF